jgi:hypothetical protein
MGAAPVISTGASTGEADRSPWFDSGCPEAQVELFEDFEPLRVAGSVKACGGARPPEESTFGFRGTRVRGIFEGIQVEEGSVWLRCANGATSLEDKAELQRAAGS